MMTLADISAFLVAIDPDCAHYEHSHEGLVPYTVWHEWQRLPFTADNRHVGGWRFQIDRFTPNEDDPIAEAIEAALENDDRITYSLQVDYERDTGYIHHIFSCEG